MLISPMNCCKAMSGADSFIMLDVSSQGTWLLPIFQGCLNVPRHHAVADLSTIVGNI